MQTPEQMKATAAAFEARRAALKVVPPPDPTKPTPPQLTRTYLKIAVPSRSAIKGR